MEHNPINFPRRFHAAEDTGTPPADPAKPGEQRPRRSGRCHVEIIGRLVDKPNIHVTKSSIPLCQMRVMWNGFDGKPAGIDVTIFPRKGGDGKDVENHVQYLDKGDQVLVAGYLDPNDWDKRQTCPHCKTVFTNRTFGQFRMFANEVVYLAKARGKDETEPEALEDIDGAAEAPQV